MPKNSKTTHLIKSTRNQHLFNYPKPFISLTLGKVQFVKNVLDNHGLSINLGIWNLRRVYIYWNLSCLTTSWILMFCSITMPQCSYFKLTIQYNWRLSSSLTVHFLGMIVLARVHWKDHPIWSIFTFETDCYSKGFQWLTFHRL